MKSTKTLIHKSLCGVSLGLSLLALCGAIRVVAAVSAADPTVQTTQIADGSETHGVKSPPKRA